MINLIVIILFLHCLGYILFKPESSILYCGIFGYIGIKQKLDMSTFLTLGCINDSRGGDSCGIFVDQKVEYGVNNDKLFSKFYLKSKLIPKIKEVSIALGHCRKASVGAINESTAQPVVIYNNKKVDFVLIHNGTLFNHQELSNKYLKNVPVYFTDSQIIAHIIYNFGFEILKEYEGGGVFVMVDYRKDQENPTTYIFKGGSKEKFNSEEISDERPLYLSIEKNSIWFSSILTYLSITRWKKGNIISPKCNILYEIKKGIIISKTLYDRKDKCQSKYYDGYYETFNYEDYWKKNKNNNILPFKTGSVSIYTSEFDNYKSPSPNKIYFDGEDYMLGNNICHGEYKVNEYGYMTSMYINQKLYTLYFYEGVLLYNKECFEGIEKIKDLFGIKDSMEIYNSIPELIHSYSSMPLFNCKTKIFDRCLADLTTTPYTGTWSPLFCMKETIYNLQEGLIKTKVEYPYNKDKNNIYDFMEHTKNIKIDVDADVRKYCNILGYIEDNE